MNLSIDQALKAIDTLAGINWIRAADALRSGDVIGDLTTVEDIAGFVAQFAPEAVYVADAAQLLALIVEAKRAGLWAPAEPDSPAMQRATGSKAR